MTHIRTKTRRRLAASSVLALVATLPATHAIADTEASTLPGGTAVTAAITTPVDGAVIGSADGTVPVTGTATVGEGEPIKDTTLVFAMDVSGSMGEPSGVDCDGVGGIDTRLACEKEAVAIANQAAAAGQSAVGLVGLASFHTSAMAHDVDLGTPGTQLLVSPSQDSDGDSIPDIEEVARSLALAGATNYAAGLNAASTIINDPLNAGAANSVIFMSDGENNAPPDISTVSVPAATNIQSFALGSGVSCTSDPLGLGSLAEVAAASTAGTGGCRQVTDLSTLADEIAEARGATLDQLTMTVDGGAATTLANAEITPDLPADGPVSASYATATDALTDGTHEICVTAQGTDAGGSSTVTDCHTVILDTTAPNVDCPPAPAPGGRTPPAGDRSPGQNEDGFYELTSTDAVDTDPGIYLVDTGSGTVFGPFADGTVVKYTEDPDATPSQKPMGGPRSSVDWHIIGTGDASVHAVDDTGNQSEPVDCLVPGPPQ